MAGLKMLSALPLSLLLVAASAAQEPPAWLEPPSSGLYTPTGEIQLTLAGELARIEMEQLGLEIDDIDVTALVVKEGERLILTPVVPLDLGPHRLRLVEYDAEGEVVERGAWTFEVRMSARLREREGEVGVGLIASQRVAEADIVNPPERLQGQGDLLLYGGAANGAWSLSGEGGFIYNSQQEFTSNGHEFDLATYLIRGTGGPFEYAVGQHDIGTRNLVLSRFNRRGVSASIPTGTRKARLTGFSMRTEAITGFRHGAGISDPDNRTSGAVWSAHPLDDRETLELSATFLDATGTEEGEGMIGDPTVQDGEAWSVAARGLAGQGRLRLEGEYAETRFDFDGRGMGSGKEDDDAYSLLAEFSPRFGSGDAPSPFLWTVGASHEKVGTLFRSLGNTLLPNDKRLTRAYTGMSAGGWALDAAIARDEDNVDDLAALPQVESDFFDLHTSYSPATAAGVPRRWRGFGTPVFDFTYNRIRQDQSFTPINYQGADTDNRTENATLAAQFSGLRWNWGILYTRGEFDDFTGLLPDQDQNLVSLHGNWILGERAGLGSYLTFNELDDTSGLQTTSRTGDLNLSLVFVPDRFSGSFRGTVNREETSDGLIDLFRTVLNADLLWTLVRPAPNRPDLNLWLSGSYQHDDDDGFGDFDASQYQIFAGVKISWSVYTGPN
jgi:hypothetical protein